MKIWKYDENNQVTHLKMIDVDDNHKLETDELLTLPNDFLTPAKLVNGALVSASAEESNASTANVVKPVPSADQQSISLLMSKVANLEKEVATLKEVKNDVSND